jgi:sugar lactone lactonase YvrE
MSLRKPLSIVLLFLVSGLLGGCAAEGYPAENGAIEHTEAPALISPSQSPSTPSPAGEDPDGKRQEDDVPVISVFAKGFRGADGIAIDSAGNMYVGNRGNNSISKADINGNVQDFVKLDCEELLCMTADKDNNLYAAGRDKVFKIDPYGNIAVLADGFSCADDLRFDGEGNLYITESREDRVYKLTPDLEKSIFIESDKDQSELGNGWYITGITFDSDFKNLYIAKMKDGIILKYPILPDGSAGSPVTVAEGLSEPDHLDIDNEGRLYVTLFRSGSLIRIDSSGSIETLCDGKMRYATGIALGKSGFDEGCAYVADYGSSVIYSIRIDQG